MRKSPFYHLTHHILCTKVVKVERITKYMKRQNDVRHENYMLA